MRPLIRALSLLLLLVCACPVHAEDVDDHEKALARNAKDSFEQRERTKAIRALAAIGTPEAARALLPLFGDPFVHLGDHVVSAFIKMLRNNKDGELHTFFDKVVLKTRDPKARCGAVTALCLSSGSELSEIVRTKVKSEKDPTVLATWARQSQRLRGHPELEGVFLPLLTHKVPTVVFEAAQAVMKFDGESAVPALRKAYRHKKPVARAGITLALAASAGLTEDDIQRVLSDKSPTPRVALALQLGANPSVLAWPGRGLELCKTLLADPSWRVRVAAVQGLLRAWHPKGLHLLIERLAKEEDPRVHDDVHRGLVTYAQHDVGTDPDLWISWWAANSERFTPTERPDPDEHGRIRWRESSHGGAQPGTKTVVFFDVPLQTSRVVFLFDLSGSMKDDAGDGTTKMELVQKQFAETVAALPKGTAFDLMVYRFPSSYPPKPVFTRALGKLKPLNKGSANKAVKWLSGQIPKGWGAFYEPLERLLDEDVDTIILLSDGRPSRGRYDRDFRILQEFPRAAMLSQVQVNTILVGTKGADRKFMQALAAATGGRFQAAGR